ncbi:MAG: TOMM precursor leader peptide-binding protein [Polyangiaceae bacterium]
MHYRLVPDIEIVELPDSAVLFRSESVQVKLEGPSARFFVDVILPRVREPSSEASVVASASGYDPSSVREVLANLVNVGVLEAEVELASFDSCGTEPFLEFLASNGIARIDADRRLRKLRIAVFGLEGIGGHAASVFAKANVGHLTLIDPFPLEKGDQSGCWSDVADAPDRLRQDAVRRALLRQSPSTDVALFEGGELTRESVTEISRAHDLVISTFDRGFLACHQWLNRASLAHGTPTLYGEYSGTRALLGPLVLPGESACYLCWRMRHIATREHFDEAMAYEEHNYRQEQPRQRLRPALPGMAEVAGGMLALEGLTLLLGFGVPRLGNGILIFDAQSLSLEPHQFLRRPDCPACHGISTAVKRGHVQLSA